MAYEKPVRESKMSHLLSSKIGKLRQMRCERFPEGGGAPAMKHASSMDSYKMMGKKTSSIRELAKKNRKK